MIQNHIDTLANTKIEGEKNNINWNLLCQQTRKRRTLFYYFYGGINDPIKEYSGGNMRRICESCCIKINN